MKSHKPNSLHRYSIQRPYSGTNQKERKPFDAFDLKLIKLQPFPFSASQFYHNDIPSTLSSLSLLTTTSYLTYLSSILLNSHIPFIPSIACQKKSFTSSSRVNSARLFNTSHPPSS
ncbi:hypothetical protein CEXT_142771 [Caerostris extrusa]|uniref:Uncharacterized protein n=1 Tax=Caerostris extrusa TaxID=172846 RepID=A0AAV4UK51_CAEEX|nr:hypothetical protein CEXT_142771 [Caerostris extrusa]